MNWKILFAVIAVYSLLLALATLYSLSVMGDP
jgi:hypothetical protein